MNNFEDKDRKEHRRKKLDTKNKEKREYSEEYRFIKKSKKELKNRISQMREEELWDDWEKD